MPDLETRAATFAALGDPHRLAIADALAITDLTPGDLATLTGLPTNLLAHHLGVMEEAGLISKTRSEGDGRRRYVTLSTEPLRSLLSVEPLGLGSVAFVCTHNSARSQFAAARYEQLTGTRATSGGTHPAPAVHPGAIEAASKYGIDLSQRVPQDYTGLGTSDLVISVCDRALEHGLPPHRRHLHWSIPDPSQNGTAVDFDRAFAQIETRVTRLLGSTAPDPRGEHP